MEIENTVKVGEEIIVKRQWMAVIAAFILFALSSLISIKVFGEVKYGVFGYCVPMLYLGTISIKNRISIIRLKGQKGYSRGTRAVVMGVIILILVVINIVIVFTPSLAKIFFPF